MPHKKVLIIEDSEDISAALKILVELEGYAAAVALTGSEGREKAVSEQPDLILMDIALPDCDGEELTRQLRCLDETARIPIVCVSSYAGTHVDEIRKNGFDEVLNKTALMSDFKGTLQKYLG